MAIFWCDVTTLVASLSMASVGLRAVCTAAGQGMVNVNIT